MFSNIARPFPEKPSLSTEKIQIAQTYARNLNYIERDGVFHFTNYLKPQKKPELKKVNKFIKPRKTEFNYFMKDKLGCCAAFKLNDEDEEIGEYYCNCYDFQVNFQFRQEGFVHM